MNASHVKTALAFDEAASLLWRQRLRLKAQISSSNKESPAAKENAEERLGSALLNASREVHRQA